MDKFSCMLEGLYPPSGNEPKFQKSIHAIDNGHDTFKNFPINFYSSIISNTSLY